MDGPTATEGEGVENADEHGRRDEHALIGDANVVRARREDALAQSRSRAAVQAALDKQTDETAAELAALRREVPGLAVNAVRMFMNTCSCSLFTVPVQI